MDPTMFDVVYIYEGATRIGICLGYASSFSHEHGVGHLAERLGFREHAEFARTPALDATITKVDQERLGFYQFGDVTYLAHGTEVIISRVMEKPSALLRVKFDRMLELRPHITENSDPTLRAAWNAQSFVVRAECDKGFLQHVHSAFLTRDIVITNRRNTKMSPSGLTIIVKSLASEEFLNKFIVENNIL